MKKFEKFLQNSFVKVFDLWKIKYFSINQLRLWYQFTMDKEGF